MRKICGKIADTLVEEWVKHVSLIGDYSTYCFSHTTSLVQNGNFPPYTHPNYSHNLPLSFSAKLPLFEHNFYPVSTGPIIKAAKIIS